MTFNPETDVVETRSEGANFVYVARHKGREVTFKVPKAAFSRITPGILGVPQRRMILATAYAEAAARHE